MKGIKKDGDDKVIKLDNLEYKPEDKNFEKRKIYKPKYNMNEYKSAKTYRYHDFKKIQYKLFLLYVCDHNELKDKDSTLLKNGFMKFISKYWKTLSEDEKCKYYEVIVDYSSFNL